MNNNRHFGSSGPSRPEVDALLELIKRKPPPKIDGLVHLAGDRRTQFTDQERELMMQSREGQILESLSRCDGHQKLIREARARWLKSRDDKRLLKKMDEERGKYVECLTYVACPRRWKQYAQCWSSLGERLDVGQLRQLKDMGPESACYQERQALELCIGGIVTGATRAAISPDYGDDTDWS